MNKGQQIILIGAFAMLIAAFLPWISVTALYGNIPGVDEGIAKGWEGDGIITGGIGLILLVGALLFKGKPGKWYSIAGVIFGVVALAIVIMDFISIAELDPDVGIFSSTDIGLNLTLVGALVAVIGGLKMTPIGESGLKT